MMKKKRVSLKNKSMIKDDLTYILPELQSLAVPIDQLNLDKQNARAHSKRNIEAIKTSLARFGQRKPIVVQKNGMIIRAGNGTVEAARDLNWSHIAAVIVDESELNAAAFGIADNRTAELAVWEEDQLSTLLKQIQDQDVDVLNDIGFTPSELEQLIKNVTGGNTDPDDVPGIPEDPITKQGDLWILGDHRLLCGNSSSIEDVKKLLGGSLVQLVNTDPPYNVSVEPRSNNAIASGMSSFSSSKTGHHEKFDLARYPNKAVPTHKRMRPKDRPLLNDFISEEEYDKLLRSWFGNISRVLEPGGSFYIWGGYANCGNYPPALKECGLYFSQAIIWVKEHPVLTRKDFMGNHEWCFYGWKKGKAHYFDPAIKNATDVWFVKKINPQSMIHLTEKPVELARLAMKYSTKRGGNVLDLFGGSGSTLIAGEELGRKVFLMELDCAYCDVIIQRWENFTKKKAKRIQQK